MTDARFDFYEVVVVQSKETKYQEINGLRGAILGMAQNNSGNWNYAVQLLDTSQDGWDIPESELTATGEFMTRKDFYDGSSIRVAVDPDTGEGEIIED